MNYLEKFLVRVEAKKKYKETKDKISAKEPCEHCVSADMKVGVKDTVCVKKNHPKAFCTDKWHETISVVEEFNSDGARMTFLGYDESIKGFIIQKICPICFRRISYETF